MELERAIGCFKPLQRQFLSVKDMFVSLPTGLEKSLFYYPCKAAPACNRSMRVYYMAHARTHTHKHTVCRFTSWSEWTLCSTNTTCRTGRGQLTTSSRRCWAAHHPRATPYHGHIAVGGTLPNARCPLLQVPRQGGGAICLPGLDRAGGPQLRGQSGGSPPGPRQARP